MNKSTFLIIFFISCVLSCSRCKEECDDPTNPDCPNYVEPVDPCANRTPVTADFIIEEKMITDFGETSYRESLGALCDIYGSSSSIIRLKAQMTGLSYNWIIGSDTINEQEYSFQFGDEYCGEVHFIPVTLIVSGPPQVDCFPEDNGTDTLTKIIRVQPYYTNPILGRYRIAWDSSPTDSFEVKLAAFEDIFIGNVFAHNFAHEELGDSSGMNVRERGYNYFNLYLHGDESHFLDGRFWLNEDGSFEAQYELDVDPELGFDHITMQDFHAHGRKIN